MRSTARDPRRAVSRLLVLLVGLVVSLGFAGSRVARAHTDIDFTLPTDGAAVGEPVSEVTVGFTGRVTLVGPGFEVIDPQGNSLTPFAVTDDDQVFRLQLDPPLAGGPVAVRYEVRAEDGHTLTGGFAFTISVEATTTTVDTTTATLETSTTTPAPTTPATTTPATTSPSVDAATVSPSSDTVAPPVDAGGSSSGVVIAIAAAVAIGSGVFLFVRSRAATAEPP